MPDLSPEEIRLLSKLHKRPASAAQEHNGSAERFIQLGLLKYSDYCFELGKHTVQELKK